MIISSIPPNVAMKKPTPPRTSPSKVINNTHLPDSYKTPKGVESVSAPELFEADYNPSP